MTLGKDLPNAALDYHRSPTRLETPSIMTERTPTLIALTGGFLTQMMPTSPRFSNLPCMSLSDFEGAKLSNLLIVEMQVT